MTSDRTEEIIDSLGMDWTRAESEQYVAQIGVEDLPRLAGPYPIVDADYSRFQYIVPRDKSVIFRDANTKAIVLVVLRNVVPNEGLRQDIVEVCKEAIQYRRYDRREDLLGQLLQTPAKQATEKDMNDKVRGMAGIIWNMMRNRLPPEIMADYSHMIKKFDFPRMDTGEDDGTFTFKINGENITFCVEDGGLELPPPSALSTINYGRYYHKGRNVNNWILAYTANAREDPTRRGYLFLPEYGIMMLPASNTISAFHGTTLCRMMEGPEHRRVYEVREGGGSDASLIFEMPRGPEAAHGRSAGNYYHPSYENPTATPRESRPARKRKPLGDIDGIPFKKQMLEQEDLRRLEKRKPSGRDALDSIPCKKLRMEPEEHQWASKRKPTSQESSDQIPFKK
ncbi:hypothetical protein F4818DRAFT_205535 [Hypoxylon cercidicola]|nr:hypothetical protein F4818DRAFT_205535 [Hypoxylon cercidicola]